ALAGREAEGLIVDPQGHWVAAPVTLGPGVTIWTLAAASMEAPPAPKRNIVPWAVAPVLLIAGLVLVVNRRRPAGVGEAVPHESTLRFGTPAHPRLSAGAEGVMVQVSSPGHVTVETSGASDELVPSRNHPRVFGRYKLLDQLGQG